MMTKSPRNLEKMVWKMLVDSDEAEGLWKSKVSKNVDQGGAITQTEPYEIHVGYHHAFL